ncbi:YchJ family protein [Phaeospirillum tilakii]|uniref:YchJ family protein n=1 Tax=Phaeospirillum tilakii TaxID=741673 RepID=A0ABW5C5P8_9PROT
MTSSCPCGSGRSYESCCQPYITGAALPPTAEALMRSRYTAFTVQAIDYLHDTLAEERRDRFNRADTEQWARDSEWVGLDILATEAGGPEDEAGRVAFRAKFVYDGKQETHLELSRFRKDQGRWVYVDGDVGKMMPVTRHNDLPGRNDPCPCGSGKKFKKCCGA